MSRKRTNATADQWTKTEEKFLARLTSPEKIQSFLDDVTYSADPIYRSPRSVMRDRQAHCFDGALFAACALERLGYRPLIIDLRAVRDDDHILALYQDHGCIGAVAKSNFVGLRFREPIFRNLRELALSYFEVYFNLDGEKSLRQYSVPLDLREYDPLNWRRDDTRLEVIAERLDAIRHFSLITPQMEKALVPVDSRSYTAAMVGVNKAGLYGLTERSDYSGRGRKRYDTGSEPR
jgi:hypothetical protein